MPEVTITLTINVPDGSAVAVQTNTPEALDPDDGDSRQGAQRWMEQHTPAAQQGLQRQLLDRLHEEFGLVGSRPGTGSRPYLNFYPESRYGDSRIGALTLNSGRFYAVLNPDLVSEFPGAEAAEGRYLTCYIRSDASVDLAINLMRRALVERDWAE